MSKPLLSWDDMGLGVEFTPFDLTVGRRELEMFKQAIGRDPVTWGALVPGGFAGILGRRSYLEDHDMPPGGLLLRHDVAWLAPAQVDVPMRAVASVQERSEDGDRRWVTVLTVAHQGGERIATISSRLGWPS